MAEQSWTDDPITAGSNRIRKKPIHFNELQDAISDWETAYSISNTTFTDSPSTGIKIRTTVITEMQDALDNLLSLATSAATGSFIWTETPVITTPIKPVHVNELRTDMNILQNDYCYQCDACDTFVDCSLCDTGCYNDVCDCNATCYSYSCSCNASCNSEGCKGDSCNSYRVWTCSCNTGFNPCDLCDNQCYVDSCDACHVANYRYPWT